MQLLERARALEAAGHDIVHMEIGEPDFAAPGAATQAAREALDRGEGHYTPSTGLPVLKDALSNWYGSEYGVSVAPERILITPGTSGAFLALYLVLLESGNTVLLPDPGYPCQRNFVRLAGGEPVNIPVGPDSRYHLNASHLAEHWRDETRAAVVTSPGNPTGTLIKPGDLEETAYFCRQRGGYLISDEIYHGLTYGERGVCALTLSDHAIIVNGFSKRWAMTGWRVGWMVVPEALIDPCRRVMQNIFISAPTLSQYAALGALGGELEDMCDAYDERRRYLLEALPPLGFEVAVTPRGAFYVYAGTGPWGDSAALCHRLLEEAGVAVTPGADFGDYRAAEHVRLSYATSLSRLQLGIERMTRYLKGETPPQSAG
ncbi:MAG: aminotransferase class I/II-fold pyridoxal phosphate-dependent enzyme [Leptospirillia bacterium]